MMKYLLILMIVQSLNPSLQAQGIGVLRDDGTIDTLIKSKVDVLYRLEFCLGKCYQFVYIENPREPSTKLFPDSLFWRFKGANPSFSTERNPYVCFDNPITTDTIGLYVPCFFYASGTYGMNGQGFGDVNTIDCKPEPDFESDRDTICQRESISFKELSQANPEFWTWYFEGGIPETWLGSDPPEIFYNETGTFDVRLIVSNETGSDTLVKSDYITVVPNPVSVGPTLLEYSEKFGTDIELNACATSNEYRWISNQNLSCYDCPNPILKATQSEIITLIVGDPESNCHDSCFFKINVESVDEKIWFPQAFSPNADGINDVFQSYGINIELKELRIYNRWGAEVFVSNVGGWNGNFNGQPMEPGVYTYYAIYHKLYSGESDWIAGEVTLMR